MVYSLFHPRIQKEKEMTMCETFNAEEFIAGKYATHKLGDYTSVTPIAEGPDGAVLYSYRWGDSEERSLYVYLAFKKQKAGESDREVILDIQAVAYRGTIIIPDKGAYSFQKEAKKLIDWASEDVQRERRNRETESTQLEGLKHARRILDVAISKLERGK